MGWFEALFYGCLLWTILALVSPTRAARLVPRRQRTRPRAGRRFGALVVLLFFVSGWYAGWAFSRGISQKSMPELPIGSRGRPTGSIVVAFVFAAVLGACGAGLASRVWRAGRRADARLSRRHWRLPALGSVRLAVEVVPPTALPLGPQLGAWEDHRTDRSLRRLTTAILALAFGVYIVLRIWRVASLAKDPLWAADTAPHASSETAAFLFLGVIGLLVLLALARGFQSYRHGRAGRALSPETAVRMNGWRLALDELPDLVEAFPSSPLVRKRDRGDRVVQELTVHATSGQRSWWAVQQRARLRRTKDAISSRPVRSSWIVWLPGLRLPSVLITGRDNTRVREWFGASIQLESDTFNRRHYAYAHPDDVRAAVAILTPPMMELLLRALPDGATLLVQDDYVCVWREGGMGGPDLCTHASLALQVADLLPAYLLRDHLSPVASDLLSRRRSQQAAQQNAQPHRPHRHPDSAPRPPIVTSVRWLGARLYQSEPVLLQRVSGDRDSLTDYLRQLQGVAAEHLVEASDGGPVHLLITVGISGHGHSGFWCDDLSGVLTAADLTSLATLLHTVPPSVAVIDPVAFTLAVAVNDNSLTFEDLPEIPPAWTAAAAAAGRPLAIPDELFEWMWGQPTASPRPPHEVTPVQER